MIEPYNKCLHAYKKVMASLLNKARELSKEHDFPAKLPNGADLHTALMLSAEQSAHILGFVLDEHSAGKKVSESAVARFRLRSDVDLDRKNKCKAITVSWVYKTLKIGDEDFHLGVDMTFTPGD